MFDLLEGSDLSSAISCITDLEGVVQWALRNYGDRHLPQGDPSTHYNPVEPSDQVLLKT